MVKIQAEEALMGIKIVAAGSGVMKKQAQMQIFRELRKQAGVQRQGIAINRENASDVLGSMGMQAEWQSTKKN